MNVSIQTLAIIAWFMVLFTIIADFVKGRPNTRHKTIIFAVTLTAYAFTTFISIRTFVHSKNETRIAEQKQQHEEHLRLEAEERLKAAEAEIESLNPDIS